MRPLIMSFAAALLGGLLFAANVHAQSSSLPRLPRDIQIARSADSPGQVTFYHAKHVNGAKPDCLVCHPTQFHILKASGPTRINHDNFEKGRQCGACHNGKKAFKIEDDCTKCHR